MLVKVEFGGCDPVVAIYEADSPRAAAERVRDEASSLFGRVFPGVWVEKPETDFNWPSQGFFFLYDEEDGLSVEDALDLEDSCFICAREVKLEEWWARDGW